MNSGERMGEWESGRRGEGGNLPKCSLSPPLPRSPLLYLIFTTFAMYEIIS